MTLNAIMKWNATTCLFFATVFLIFPREVINFLSTNTPMPVLVLQILAIILLINGLHLLQTANKQKISKIIVVYFSITDFSWVLFSLFLVMCNLWVTSSAGIISTIVVAVMVALFAVLQLSKMNNTA